MADKTTQVNDGLGLPYSLEAEQSVLGAVLVEPDQINHIADVLKPEYFYLPEHQAIFAVMLVMALKKVHPIIVILASAAVGIAVGYLGLW